MGRQADPRKAAAWERRLARYGDSGLTVAQFCEREGVSVASFQYWQRKLRSSAGSDGSSTWPAAAAARFDPVEVVSRQAVTIRFASGAAMEIPDDREDLVKAVARALAGESEPC